MKVVQINITSGIGSTGKIAVALSNLMDERGIENYIIHSGETNSFENSISLGLPRVYYKAQALKSRVLGNYGFNSYLATWLIIHKLKKISPDIVHLHNIHGHNVNVRILFNYLSKSRIKVIWSFHDCWAFTGYCTHFDAVGCDKWKNRCYNCIQRNHYSWVFDNSCRLFEIKKRLLQAFPHLYIVCPSDWMKGKVLDSFLFNKRVFVINNGINLQVFNQETIQKVDHRYSDKIVILAVSFIWDNSKGLDVISRLSYDLSDRFQLIVVGLNEKQKLLFSSKTVCLNRTKSQAELASLYSDADLFINPTREDSFPTVNIESLACGTPVLTFNTGGSPEIIDENTGFVVEKDDYDSFFNVIKSIEKKNEMKKKECRQRALVFQDSRRFQEFIQLYNVIVKEK